MMELNGLLQKITFHSKDTHYTVAKMETSGQALVTIVGHLPGAAPGQTLNLRGQWVTHPRYGEQFSFENARITRPSDIDGMVQYLGSGAIKGIGPWLAKSIIATFGAESLNILDTQPLKLVEVPGIGKTKAQEIARQWQRHKSISDIMEFLQQHGIRPGHAGVIFRQYGPEAMEVLTQRPFQLAEDIPQTGFMIADAVARDTGTEFDPQIRAAACIEYLIHQACQAGHMFFPENPLIERLEKNFEIPPSTAGLAVNQLIESGKINAEENPDLPASLEDGGRHIYLSSLYLAETGIASRICAMKSVCRQASGRNSENIIRDMEEIFFVKLSCDQLAALQSVLNCAVSVVTGGPGTGKTTLIRCMAHVFEKTGCRVCLSAPTGRAARRLAEITGKESHTIHKLLGYHFETGFFERSADNPIEADVLIVDEASMIDAQLMYNLLCATPVSARLILVGDMFQLPPVGPGNVLADIIDSGQVPVHFLTEIFRQARQSAIVKNAHLIRQGFAPEPEVFDTDKPMQEFCMVEAQTPEEAARIIVDLFTRILPETYGLGAGKDIQVLSPVHKGPAGTISLNRGLQKKLNDGQKFIDSLDHQFCLNDRVLHLKNNYSKEVFNGDTGTITDIDPAGAGLTVDYDGRRVDYDADELDELTLGYAITVHKSQGSEYPAVILPILTRHYVMLQRNLLYTAITRARHLVILVGSTKAISVAVRNDTPAQRLSNLSKRLKNWQI
jgi:exodeoxyribonuclease V alpha subunit